jgi:hypothetical protein
MDIVPREEISQRIKSLNLMKANAARIKGLKL